MSVRITLHYTAFMLCCSGVVAGCLVFYCRCLIISLFSGISNGCPILICCGSLVVHFYTNEAGWIEEFKHNGGQCLIDVTRFSAVQYMLLAALRFETDSFCFSLKSLTFYISRVFFHRGV